MDITLLRINVLPDSRYELHLAVRLPVNLETLQALDPPSRDTQPIKTPPSPVPAPVQASVEPPKAATDKTRDWMLTRLTSQFGDKPLLDYAHKHNILLPGVEFLTDWPLAQVPTTPVALRELADKVAVFLSGAGDPPAR